MPLGVVEESENHRRHGNEMGQPVLLYQPHEALGSGVCRQQFAAAGGKGAQKPRTGKGKIVCLRHRDENGGLPVQPAYFCAAEKVVGIVVVGSRYELRNAGGPPGQEQHGRKIRIGSRQAGTVCPFLDVVEQHGIDGLVAGTGHAAGYQYKFQGRILFLDRSGQGLEVELTHLAGYGIAARPGKLGKVADLGLPVGRQCHHRHGARLEQPEKRQDAHRLLGIWWMTRSYGWSPR